MTFKKIFFKINQIPNLLTLFRIAIIPLMVMSFYIPGMLANVVTAFLFGIAAITDYFDGYLARYLKVQSNFGKCLDPIADKLLVIVAIVMLIKFNPYNPWILFPGLIIICREVLVSGLREYLAELNVRLPVTILAKYKAGVQMFGIGGMLLGDNGSAYVLYQWIGGYIEVEMKYIVISVIGLLAKILFCFAAFLTVVTGYSYWQTSLKNM